MRTLPDRTLSDRTPSDRPALDRSAFDRSPSRRVRIIGGGRAGRSFALALSRVGWEVAGVLGRTDPRRQAARDVDLLLLATPDTAIAAVASTVEPVAGTVVAHVAGSLGPDVLGHHARRGALHPLTTLPNPEEGAARLLGGWFAVAGDPLVAGVVTDLGGRAVRVADDDRASYHAAAVMASNHVVALLGQVERVAAGSGVPFAAYLDLVRSSVDQVARLGPAGALTGPVARGDWDTVRLHLRALPDAERPAYLALAHQAARLAGRPWPELATSGLAASGLAASGDLACR